MLGWIGGKSGGGSATKDWDAGLYCEGLGFDRVGNDLVALDVEKLTVQWQEQMFKDAEVSRVEFPSSTKVHGETERSEGEV